MPSSFNGLQFRRQVSDAMLFAFMTDEDWRTLVLKGVPMFCTVRSAYFFPHVFFSTHHITVCLNLSWHDQYFNIEILKCKDQLDGLHQIVSDRKVGLFSAVVFFARKQHGLPPNPNIPEQLGSFRLSQVVTDVVHSSQFNTSSLTNSLYGYGSIPIITYHF